jgi:hypothetical protein
MSAAKEQVMKQIEDSDATKVPGGADAQPTSAEAIPVAPSAPRCVLEIDDLPPAMPVRHVQA